MHPFNHMRKLEQSMQEIMIQDVISHLAFFSDYILANTALILSHGKVLSLFNFKTYSWNHITPEDEI